MINSKIFLGAYLLAGSLNVLAQLLDLEELRNYTKPLLMPILLFFVYESSKGRVTLLILLLSLAILLSWGGDLALMYDGDIYFMVGLGLFLMAHVVYSYLFLKSINFRIQVGYVRILPVIAFTALFVYYILPHTGDMTIPVILYALIISIMAITATLREGGVSEKSFRLVTVGSILFILSDSMIGLSKFASPFAYSEFGIMSTYVVAQLLIAMGVLVQNADQSA